MRPGGASAKMVAVDRLSSMPTNKHRLYRVSFSNQGQVYEVYARNVSHGSMLGFVEIEKLVFGEKSSVVVDPGEEKLKTEFANVERFFVPMHSIIRIDEVTQQGPARIVAGEGGSKVTPFPIYTLGGDRNK
jgi:hypothetical protein